MAKCRVFGIDDGLKELVKDGLYTKHLYGETFSVSVVKFVETAGAALEAKSHRHGEEASLQLRGACSVFQGEAGPAADPEFPLGPLECMFIPCQAMHYGANVFDENGVSMRLNVVSPPRREFGPEDAAPYYPLKSRS